MKRTVPCSCHLRLALAGLHASAKRTTRISLAPRRVAGSPRSRRLDPASVGHAPAPIPPASPPRRRRSGEHTSGLQSHLDLVSPLLLQKKKTAKLASLRPP